MVVLFIEKITYIFKELIEGEQWIMTKKKKYKKNKEQSGVIGKIASEFQVPVSVLPGVYHIEILGNKEAIIDGCKGVLEYEDNSIKLNLNSKSVRFRGMNLELKAYAIEQVIISGIIISIEFSD